jgi:hypothetical protein
MMAKIRTRKQRRGLSTIVGAVFMILIIAGALNVALWTMRQQDRVTESIIEKTNTNLNRLNEDLNISDIRVSAGKLNVTVANAGGAASYLKTLYIVNETASPKQQYRYDIDATVDGRSSARNIGQSNPEIVLDNNTDYSIRVVSQSGTTASSRVSSLLTTALPMSLYVIPPTVIPGTNVTVLFAVTNNITDGHIAQNPELKLSYTMTCGGGPDCQLTKIAGPTTNATMVSKGNTMFYKWVFKTTSPDKTYVTFNASFVDAKQDNYVTETAYLKKIDEVQTATSTLQVIFTSLVQKPDIFLILPSTWGESGDEGLWGLVIANPVNATMKVSRIVLNTYTSKTTSGGVQLINSGPGGSCSDGLTPIYPPTSSEWKCPHENMVEWKDVNNPEIIKEYEAKSFLFRLDPGDIGDQEPAFTVTATVFTDFGQFTKAGYAVGMDNGNHPLINVYMTNTTNTSQAVSSARMLGHLVNITSGAYVRLNLTVADLDSSGTTYLKSGGNLTINVPQGFSKVNVTSHTGFSTPAKRNFYDGSTQITAELSEDVGNIPTEAKIIQVEAFAPSVTSKKIYIMYLLADGETQNSFSIGPVGEIVLQVKPA